MTQDHNTRHLRKSICDLSSLLCPVCCDLVTLSLMSWMIGVQSTNTTDNSSSHIRNPPARVSGPSVMNASVNVCDVGAQWAVLLDRE